MTNLLLITDVPRLRKIFSRLSDEKDVRLRIANSLEKGAEEIIADKPDVVFVQTHLSGLSADILLMHLKKQLGRKRSRFVLLSPMDQAGAEVIKLYQGHLDTSPENSQLFDNIREVIAGFAAKRKKDSPGTAAGSTVPEPQQQRQESVEAMPLQEMAVSAAGQQPDSQMASDAPAALMLQQMAEKAEPSLEEQGITYSPRPRLSVYSEFTSSFDNAVSSMQPAEPVPGPQAGRHHDWDHGDTEIVESSSAGSKRTTFLLWLAPVLVAVIAVTMIQHRKSKPAPLAVAPAKLVAAPSSSNKAATVAPAATETKAPSAPMPATPQKPAGQTAAAGVEGQLSERAVLSAIAENRGGSGQAKGAPAAARPTALPDFIPRYGLDKKYGAANPGWERYKGEVTEFKVFREGGSIKAIQVIDRGGQGVPESFMKGVLKQVSKKTVFTLEASNRKEGYEIQRGQLAENLNVVYYRDEQGGRLRAFVLTWK